MSNTPNDLRYTKTHEWLRLEKDDTVTVGITDHAQSLLGDLVFVELPEIGLEYRTGDEVGVVESVKAAADIYSPLDGEIIAVNEALNDAPEVVNHDPYGDGWLYRLKPMDVKEVNELMDSEHYKEQLAEEA